MATHIDDSVLAACVDRLRDAQLTQVPCRPVRDLLGSVDAAAAYRVQEHLMNEELSRGAKVSGWKIGLTSKAVQQQLGVSEPDFGVLLAHRGFRSGGEVPLKGLLQPRFVLPRSRLLRSSRYRTQELQAGISRLLTPSPTMHRQVFTSWETIRVPLRTSISPPLA